MNNITFAEYRIYVKDGEKIKQGQEIAEVGSTR